ncbi:hypothetical protein AXF41_09745 [Clostridium haemolyticum]|nr:hypothetical protein AXF41_09745 [Clostridium haemolyticum]
MFIMYIFIITSITLIVLILLLALIPLKIYFNANSYNLFNSNILFSWFNEFLKAKIICDNTGSLILNIYFYKKLIKTKPLILSNKSKNILTSNKINILKNLKINSIDIKTYYGFEDPSLTGVICGIINLIPCFSYKNNISNYPNFNSDITYFDTSGKIHLNLLFILTQIVKNKFKISFNNISYANK